MAGFLIAKAHAVFHARADEVLADADTRDQALRLPDLIAERAPSPSRAWLRMRVDRTTMVAIVDDLEGPASFIASATRTTGVPMR